jgi:hypothetical protein
LNPLTDVRERVADLTSARWPADDELITTMMRGVYENLIVGGGRLAGTGAHSYSAGNPTGGSEEAEKFKQAG